VKIFKQNVLSLKSYSKEFFSRHPSFKFFFQKIIKSLPNWIKIPASIHFSYLSRHQGVSVPRIVVEIGSYLSMNIPLFSSVYSIYPSATPHMSRSHLHVKHSKCPNTHKSSLQSTNHFWISHTPFLSSFSSHNVQKNSIFST
jgi:hypothetical protein